MRIVAAVVCLMALSACGGGGGSSTPTTPTPQPPTPAPPTTWSLSGDVVATLTGTPVAGAVVTAGELRATTDGSGRFELSRSTAPSSPLAVRVEAEGYLVRVTGVGHPRSAPLRIDLIRDAPPFSLELYRALVRNGQEAPDFRANMRWTVPVAFYVRTLDDTGRRVEPEVLQLVKAELAAAWRAWTSGKYHVSIEEGEAERTDTAGLVRVLFGRKPEGRICGKATVGGNYGWMQFYLDGCDCGSRKVDPAVVWHEVGHTAGFTHVTGAYLMSPYLTELCNRRAEVTGVELHHARVAYERPRGNMDPDTDPASYAMALPPATGRQFVSCYSSH